MSILLRLELHTFLLLLWVINANFPLFAQTSIYTGSLEKNLDTGEIKVNSSAGPSASVVKTIKPDGTTTLAYVHSDHLGSASFVTDDKGNKTADIQYYPYGETYNLEPITYNLKPISDRLYTGQRQDVDIDLYFYNARYYNPATGKFLSADKAQGPNRYSYVGNNPVMRNDPSGNEVDPVMLYDPMTSINIINNYETYGSYIGAKGVASVRAVDIAISRSPEQVLQNLCDTPWNISYFVPSDNSGVIDTKHVLATANETLKTINQNNKITKIPMWEIGVYAAAVGASWEHEEKQLEIYGDSGSYYSYEDVPSNALGVSMAIQMSKNPDIKLSEQMRLMYEKSGGRLVAENDISTITNLNNAKAQVKNPLNPILLNNNLYSDPMNSRHFISGPSGASEKRLNALARKDNIKNKIMEKSIQATYSIAKKVTGGMPKDNY